MPEIVVGSPLKLAISSRYYKMCTRNDAQIYLIKWSSGQSSSTLNFLKKCKYVFRIWKKFTLVLSSSYIYIAFRPICHWCSFQYTPKISSQPAVYILEEDSIKSYCNIFFSIESNIRVLCSIL